MQKSIRSAQISTTFRAHTVALRLPICEVNHISVHRTSSEDRAICSMIGFYTYPDAVGELTSLAQATKDRVLLQARFMISPTASILGLPPLALIYDFEIFVTKGTVSTWLKLLI